METPDIQAIRAAVKELTYPSESDEPFDVFQWPGAPGSASDQLAARAGADRQIAQVAIDHFFAQLDGSDDAPRFAALRQALQSNLAEFAIFRVGDGEVRVDLYLIGKTRAGEWAGVHTLSVET